MPTQFGKHSTLIASQSDKDKILFFAAVLLALSLAVIFIMIVNAKSGKGQPAPQAQSASQATPISAGTVTLYAPRAKVKAGSLLDGQQFEEKFWPRNQIPEGAVRDIAELTGMYAREDLEAGVPIQRVRLTKEQLLVSLPLSQGMRAVTIEVDETAGIEGWATPGTRVDVVVSTRDSADVKAKIIVQSAKILSLGGDLATIRDKNLDPTRTSRRVGRTTLTLEVTTQDALKIEAAKGLGRLSLLLRAQGDTQTAQDTEVGVRELVDSSKKKPEDDLSAKCSPGIIKMGPLSYQMCGGKLVLLDGASEP